MKILIFFNIVVNNQISDWKIQPLVNQASLARFAETGHKQNGADTFPKRILFLQNEMQQNE